MTQQEGGKDTAILIVTYNSAHVIGECLAAAMATKAEILVIDNHSQDRTAEVVRGFPVTLIANGENRGFAGAVNQGVRRTSAPYLLLLNPDAILATEIGTLRDLLRNPGVGAAAGLLTSETGRIQTGFSVRRLPTPAALGFEVLGVNRLFPSNPVNWRFRCFDLDLASDAVIPVEQPAGAFLMFRRQCWEELGGLDERFHPLWFEDVDFCARLKQAGYQILLASQVRAKHTGAHSILNMALEIRQIYWYGNVLRYSSKHFPPRGRKTVCASVIAGAGLRGLGSAILWVVSGRKRQVGVWREVARLAVRCFAGHPGWDEIPKQGGAPN